MIYRTETHADRLRSVMYLLRENYPYAAAVIDTELIARSAGRATAHEHLNVFCTTSHCGNGKWVLGRLELDGPYAGFIRCDSCGTPVASGAMPNGFDPLEFLYESLSTHEHWLEYALTNPDDPALESHAGGVDHHRRCRDGYGC